MLFSGYLSFTELTAKACAIGTCQTIAGIPVCIYGLAMYAIIFAIAFFGRKQ